MNLNLKKYNKIILATNVHTGGGLSLIQSLIPYLGSNTLIVIDSRAKDYINFKNLYLIKPTLISRIILEFRLYNLNSNQTIISFTNLPPFLKLKAKTVLFLQNALLLSSFSLKKYSLKQKIRISVERLLLSWFYKNVQTIIVQTNFMKSLLQEKFKISSLIMPFHSTIKDNEHTEVKEFDFLYVADLMPHKNHENLLHALEILSKKNIRPKLCLTLKKNNKNFKKLKKVITKSNLSVSYKTFSSEKDKIILYKKSKCLIYPSLLESFGIPLMEASDLGIPVIASDLPFVHDFGCSFDLFDPFDPESISICMENFLNLYSTNSFSSTPKPKNIFSPKRFIENFS